MRIVVHLDGDSAGEVLVAVQKAGRPVQSVPSVICDGHVLIFVFPLDHIFFDSPIAGHSFGVLCAAHRNIHCSVAVIWKQVTIVT